MSDHNELPEELFDLLSSKPFEELSAAERKFVSQYLSEPEYNEMHAAACGALYLSQHEARAKTLRSEILSAFDVYHGKSGTANSRIIWRAAAIIAVIISTLSLTRFIGSFETNPRVVSIRDTVFIEKPGAVIYDTVFTQPPAAQVKKVRGAVATVQPGRALQDRDNLHVLPLSELQSDANSLKGNSMVYDSLSLAFEYASM